MDEIRDSQLSLLWPPGWSNAIGAQCQASLAKLPGSDRIAVISALTAYRRTISVAFRGNEFLNTNLARLMVDGLETAWSQEQAYSPLHRHWLLAATAYLLDPDDRNQDFADLDGFDDDAVVVAAALRALGFGDIAQLIENLIE